MRSVFKMKDVLILIYFSLLVFFTKVRSDFRPEIDSKHRNCTFILANGNYQEFLDVVPSFEKCTRQFENAVLEIKLFNYTLPGFPNGTFTKLPYLDRFKLEISGGSQVHLLSPMLPEYFVFKYMKFKTAKFDISDAASLSGWNWTVLSEFEDQWIDSFEFIAVRSKIIRLSSEFNKVANGRLTAIRIFKCQLRWLAENVFESFSNLESLELCGNFIEKLDRSHLPKSASELHTLDLGENRLQYLPSDLFTDFPKLRNVFLEGNNIKISFSQMESILRAKSIEDIYGAIWPCHCCKLQNLIKKFSAPKVTNTDLDIYDAECYTARNDRKTVRDFLTFPFECRLSECVIHSKVRHEQEK